MRQQVVELDQAGVSPWLLVDNRRHGTDFNLGIRVDLQTASDLTYSVEATKDRNAVERVRSDLAIARVTTTATGTLLDHGLKTGDSVRIYDTNFTSHNPEPNLEGLFTITVVDKDVFTYTVVDTGAVAASPARILTFSVHDLLPALTSNTVADNDLLVEPVSAVRLNITSFTAGSAKLTVLQQG